MPALGAAVTGLQTAQVVPADAATPVLLDDFLGAAGKDVRLVVDALALAAALPCLGSLTRERPPRLLLRRVGLGALASQMRLIGEGLVVFVRGHGYSFLPRATTRIAAHPIRARSATMGNHPTRR